MALGRTPHTQCKCTKPPSKTWTRKKSLDQRTLQEHRASFQLQCGNFLAGDVRSSLFPPPSTPPGEESTGDQLVRAQEDARRLGYGSAAANQRPEVPQPTPQTGRAAPISAPPDQQPSAPPSRCPPPLDRMPRPDTPRACTCMCTRPVPRPGITHAPLPAASPQRRRPPRAWPWPTRVAEARQTAGRPVAGSAPRTPRLPQGCACTRHRQRPHSPRGSCTACGPRSQSTPGSRPWQQRRPGLRRATASLQRLEGRGTRGGHAS
mmetsp:Transcript_40022/g.119187  ORF Transcript_40022/g.119187 Transcript_40022/m.119187 type:complete len:263 (-) Transcript_40022:1821-2609(-)